MAEKLFLAACPCYTPQGTGCFYRDIISSFLSLFILIFKAWSVLFFICVEVEQLIESTSTGFHFLLIWLKALNDPDNNFETINSTRNWPVSSFLSDHPPRQHPAIPFPNASTLSVAENNTHTRINSSSAINHIPLCISQESEQLQCNIQKKMHAKNMNN